ncbi:hypothetical protein EYF80_053749 [Liparis tanakae]|uniref:Uncharacterized protein n=1 Tax=Liparis tanakae TaxID=230148 RepID=A0A4Z2F4P8_9TELE|nr:hypothetical protein EYF80_053749 [Liparis tanakae]
MNIETVAAVQKLPAETRRVRRDVFTSKYDESFCGDPPENKERDPFVNYDPSRRPRRRFLSTFCRRIDLHAERKRGERKGDERRGDERKGDERKGDERKGDGAHASSPRTTMVVDFLAGFPTLLLDTQL